MLKLQNKKTIRKVKLSLYTKLINFFLLKGKKQIVKKKIDLVLNLLIKELQVSATVLLYTFFNRLKTYVEIKKIKKRKRTFLVPTPIAGTRRVHLTLTWLYSSIASNKSKISFEKKLYSEMFSVLLNQRCMTIDLLDKNNKLSIESRVNLHYRW